MIIYIVEMWRYGCDWAQKVAPDMQNVALDFDNAKNRFDNYKDWTIGIIYEYSANSGDFICSHYFENEDDVANPVEFNQIYGAYR